jgi:hypothetical protein
MTIADEAAANALPCELVKYALRQSKDGIVISFVVHPSDIPAALQTSRIGSRWMAALVQIGDDELPIPPTEKGKSKAADSTPAKLQPDTDKHSAGAKRDWREMPPQQRAGIRINEPTFAAYLREEHSTEWRETGEADACLKFICKIESKRDLAANHKALTMFNLLDSDYLGWLAKERIGA